MTEKLQIEIRDSLADVPAEEWNALDPDDNPFLRHEFLHGLEISGCLGSSTGWHPRHVLLRLVDPHDESRPGPLIGAVPAYLKTNSYGEFVFDWAWADAYQRHGMAYYPKLVAAIPFTPATGRRLLVRPDQPYEETVRLLATAVRRFAASEDYSSVHFLFVTEAESALLCARPPRLAEADEETDDEAEEELDGSQERSQAADAADTAHPADVADDEDGVDEVGELDDADDNLRRLDCQYHWANPGYATFDDFLGDCTSKRRKTIRRERRHVEEAGLVLERRQGGTLSEAEWQDVHDLYRSTYDRKWGNPSLTEGFFRRMGETFAEHTLVVLARDPADATPARPVACSIMFTGGGTLFGRYWGCRREYNSLHFEACYYQGIEHCIEHGIARFEPGAQGEHKITRGFVPTLTRSAHWIAHPQFRDAVARYLNEEVPHVEQRCAGLADLLPFKSDIHVR